MHGLQPAWVSEWNEKSNKAEASPSCQKHQLEPQAKVAIAQALVHDAPHQQDVTVEDQG